MRSPAGSMLGFAALNPTYALINQCPPSGPWGVLHMRRRIARRDVGWVEQSEAQQAGRRTARIGLERIGLERIGLEVNRYAEPCGLHVGLRCAQPNLRSTQPMLWTYAVVLYAPRAGPANALSLVPRWLGGKAFGEIVEHRPQCSRHVFA